MIESDVDAASDEESDPDMPGLISSCSDDGVHQWSVGESSSSEDKEFERGLNSRAGPNASDEDNLGSTFFDLGRPDDVPGLDKPRGHGRRRKSACLFKRFRKRFMKYGRHLVRWRTLRAVAIKNGQNIDTCGTSSCSVNKGADTSKKDASSSVSAALSVQGRNNSADRYVDGSATGLRAALHELRIQLRVALEENAELRKRVGFALEENVELRRQAKSADESVFCGKHHA
jgi:hypothetical protein